MMSIGDIHPTNWRLINKRYQTMLREGKKLYLVEAEIIAEE
jgi:hypothetical protein